MRKVAIIYARFGPYHVARLRGAQRILSSDGWKVKGIEVCPDDRFYAWNKVEDETQRIALLPGRSYNGVSHQTISRAVAGALASERPDVVVSPGWYCAESIAAAQWCRRNNRTAILMSKSGRQDHKRRWWRELYKQHRIRLFDAALVGGRKHAEYLIDLGMPKDRISLGHNVVDNAHFARGAKHARNNVDRLRDGLGLPDRYLFASGRFLPRKNFSRLLEAYYRYLQRDTNAPMSLVVCGDGPQRTDLQAHANKLGISQFVHWPGFVQYDDLPCFYALAGGFIMPSTVEPWGLVVNEAMASGLPVLVSTACGASELLKPNTNGFDFDPYEIDSICGAMLTFSELDSDAVEQMGRASKEIIAEWGPERFGKGLREAILSTMGSQD